jgi:hypothetical protein
MKVIIVNGERRESLKITVLLGFQLPFSSCSLYTSLLIGDVVVFPFCLLLFINLPSNLGQPTVDFHFPIDVGMSSWPL